MPLKKATTFDTWVEESATFTTSALSGEANTIASFLSSAIVIRLSMCVALDVPAIIKLI